MRRMTLADCIRKTAARTPQKEALVFNEQRLSYEDLENRSGRIARALSEMGLNNGDRVGIFMPNCVENVLFFLAVLKAGCIEVNLNPDIGMETTVRAFKHAGISVLAHKNVPPDELIALQNAMPDVKCITPDESQEDFGLSAFNGGRSGDTADSGQPAKASETLNDADPAMIQFTSGTTGIPKGATLSQKSFIAASKARYEELGLSESDRILNILRLSHSCGKSLLFDAFVHGSTQVLAKGFVPPSTFLKTILNEKIAVVTGPPLLFHHLIKLKNNAEVVKRLEESLKILEIGLSAAPSGLFRELRNVFPWATIVNRYGLTENAGAASLMVFEPKDPVGKTISCGKGMQNIVLEASNFNENGESGSDPTEICIKGETLMIGYWEDLQKGRRKDYPREGFATGDLAKRDSDGLFYVIGRKDDIMNVAGEKIAPKEIEDVIMQFPGMIEAAVFGIEDDALGEKIVAFYYSEPKASEIDVKRHCARHLPSFMAPHVLVSSETALPKNPSGKISRRELKKSIRLEKTTDSPSGID